MPELTYTVTGLVGSDIFTGPTISTTAINTSTPGEYDIIAVTLGSSVTTISDQAFYNCITLKKVAIPAKAKIKK